MNNNERFRDCALYFDALFLPKGCPFYTYSMILPVTYKSSSWISWQSSQKSATSYKYKYNQYLVFLGVVMQLLISQKLIL